MKVLLLSDANSPHTIKWAKSLSRSGIDIAIWSFNAPKKGIYEDTPNIKIQYSRTPQNRTSIVAKLKYLRSLPNLRRFLKDFRPDILHAHYATSYGLLGRLCKFKPFIISVWGADVYDFPKKGKLYRRLVQKNLLSATKILSTSEDMKRVTFGLIDEEIIVTPFGIDLDVFYNIGKQAKSDSLVFGTIKTLEEKYGIGFLIRAYAIFKERHPNADTRLLIVGGGSQERELKVLAKKLKIEEECTFTGLVPYTEVPFYHNELDIAIFPSVLDSESFGVAAVEASATERPVIVSDVGGLPEVIEHGRTGIVVPPKDPVKLADAMEKLFLSSDLRISMGKAGRERVREFYDLNENVKQMLGIYRDVLK